MAYHFFSILQIGITVFMSRILIKMKGQERRVYSDKDIFRKIERILQEMGITYEISKNVKPWPFEMFDKCYSLGTWSIMVRENALVMLGGIPIYTVSVGPLIETNFKQIRNFQKKMDEQVCSIDTYLAMRSVK